jgi:hypothetical protein
MLSCRNDPCIPDDAFLYRRIIPKWFVANEDGTKRISSAAFKDGNGELSVNVASLTTPRRVLQGRPDDRLAQLQARIPRSLKLNVMMDVKPGDPSHAVICPEASKSQARRMAAGATLVDLARRWSWPKRLYLRAKGWLVRRS